MLKDKECTVKELKKKDLRIILYKVSSFNIDKWIKRKIRLFKSFSYEINKLLFILVK